MQNLLSVLTEQLKVAADDAAKALLYQQRNGGRIEQILVRMGALSSESLPGFYATMLQLPRLASAEFEALQQNTEWLASVKQLLGSEAFLSVIQENLLIISAEKNGSAALQLKVISACPSEYAGFERISSLWPQAQVETHVCSEDQYAVLRKIVSEENTQVQSNDLSVLEEDRLRELASEAPTVNLLNNLIAKGLRRRASDMHIEPWKQKGRVRYRIDGVLQEAELIQPSMLLPVITRLKLLSKMDIAEKRRPQDGKIEMRIDGRNVDIRVSALPVGEGESVVMRFLLQDSLSYDIKTLGIEPDIEEALLQELQATSGVILMTGPTGSGKTTSLYSFLSRRNEPGVKIITIEDPIEYQLDGINQVQVQSEIGYTFANALRSVVRQDPDIIMIGEIRDLETAGIAMQSALTGHLVFSTLHTNDAPSAYTRLLDLGIEDFLLSAAVRVILAQRLVRKLCPHCHQPDHEAEETVRRLQLNWVAEYNAVQPEYRKAVGCDHCGHTGYAGRIAIIEYMRCDDELRQLLGQQDFLVQARLLNRKRGYRNLLEDGVLKAMRGKTTLDEVLRVAG